MGFKEKVFRLSTYKERGTNFAQTVARMPRESGVNVLRKMREYGTNIVQTVARRWRENGIKKIPTFIGIFRCLTWTRTRDNSVNSRTLYQLSYEASIVVDKYSKL
jgi:hypothetical protein